MGSVWVAVHVELDSPLAIKFQHVAGSSALADDRFRREAKAAAQLRNPHVVHIYDYGFDDGVPFIAMELIAGESLQERLQRDHRIRIDQAADFVRQAATALDLAHEQGVIHRDIKPGNLFIARHGQAETIKLLDFGIAKWTDADQQQSRDLTDSAVLVGSIVYMSPEQARGAKIDHRTDLWSLTVVAYEMVTGIAPFQGTNIPDSLRRICSGMWDRPSTILGPAYAELDRFLERALREAPGERFRSAGELADELVRCAGRVLHPSGEGRMSGTASMTLAEPATISASAAPTPLRQPGPRRSPSRYLGVGLALAAGIGGVVVALARPSLRRKPSDAATLADVPRSIVSPAVAPVADSGAPPEPRPDPAATAIPSPRDKISSRPVAVQRRGPRSAPRPTPAARAPAHTVDPIFGLRVAPSP